MNSRIAGYADNIQGLLNPSRQPALFYKTTNVIVDISH